MRNGAVKFDKLDTLVLDEADWMMDMGFWPDVRRIVAALPDAAARQTLLFSATMPDDVMRLADEVVRDAKFVQVGSAGGPAKSITHTIENVAAQKAEWLAKFLRRADGPVLVFVRTKSGAERLARRLAAGGLKAAALHADRTQAQRRRRSKASAAAAIACSLRPTSLLAASTSTASRTSSTTRSRRIAKRMCTALAVPAALRRPAPRSRSSLPRSSARCRHYSVHSDWNCRLTPALAENDEKLMDDTNSDRGMDQDLVPASRPATFRRRGRPRRCRAAGRRRDGSSG